MSAATEIYGTLLSRYPSATPSRSAQEAFSVLEFQFRLLGLVSNGILRAVDSRQAPAVPRSAGMGEWITFLRVTSRSLNDRTEPVAVLARATVFAVLEDFDARSSEGGGLKRLRDHLAHGGPVPVDLSRSSIDALILSIDERLIAFLDAASVSYGTSRSGIKRPILSWSGQKVSLWPTLFVRGRDWHVYSRASGENAAAFFVYGDDAVSSLETSDEVLDAVRDVVRVGRQRGPFSAYLTDVEQDLAGFAEVGTPISTSDTEDGFEVVWEKATSEGTEARRDYFRLGLDDRREWRGENEWVPYTRYLRKLVRWDMVATRLHQSLQTTATALDHEENIALGWDASSRTYRAARVQITDLAGSVERTCSFDEMMGNVDEDLQSNRGQTQVVFLNGEAGIGKTRAMLEAAIARAAVVAESDEEHAEFDLPLYLFVQSTGQVLDNLNTVVAGAVVRTRILTDDGVRALCRNGLMAILIDGFDELLGNARYGDALGSLRPWLNALGGRGVMVVSARSSYYVGQYRTSVARAQRANFPSVRHRIAEMQKWSGDEVRLFAAEFDLEDNLAKLPPDDRRLLQLPFFARVFVEMCRTFQGSWQDVSLAEYLLDQYVAREETKIRGRDGESFLTQSELKRLFATLAELMDEQSEREADEELLKSAAELTIGDQLIAREGLSERLPALCGLSVAGGADVLRFRFQHELFFDQFLAAAATAYLRSDHDQAFVRMLVNSAWRSATISSIVSNVSLEPLTRVLAGGLRVLPDISDQQRAVLSANLGALWSEIVRVSRRMRYEVRDATFSDALDLSNAEAGWLRLQNCDVAQLTFPGVTGWEVDLRDTRVVRIDARRAPRLDGLRGVQTNRVEQLLHANKLVERPALISSTLNDLGAQLDDRFTDSVDTVSEAVLAAEYFLSALESRAEYTILLDQKTLMPSDDPVPKWTKEYGRAGWSSFVNSMKDSGLASLEKFNSSGKAKLRFRLTRSARQILERDASFDDVRGFWAGL